MALEQYFQETELQPRGKCELLGGDDDLDNPVTSSSAGGFECNICLDTVNDPVVTLCGHLFCWPCIYKWLQFRTKDENSIHRQSCPVCKAEVTEASLVPLYGRGTNHTTTKPPCKPKAPSRLGVVIPRRPNFCGLDSPRTPSPSPSPSLSPYRGYGASYLGSPRRSSAGGVSASNLLDHPGVGLYGEMVYARVFGNSITNLYTYPNSYNLARNASPRVRRHVLQADRSLSRVCFFLCCCLILCLLLF